MILLTNYKARLELLEVLYAKGDKLDAATAYAKTLNSEHEPKTVAQFILLNVGYITEHGLRDADISKALKMQKAIEKRNLATSEILPLDSVHVTARNGVEYPNAVFLGEYYRDGRAAICQNASIHVGIYEGNIHHSVSGGSFPTIDQKALIREGCKDKQFWTWGTSGACGNGGIYFNAKVKNFTLTDHNQY